MDNTYMSLSSSKNIRIFNNTNFPADFEWKTYFSEKDEAEKKKYLLQQLDDEELQEILKIDPNDVDLDMESLDSDDSYDEQELAARKERLLEAERGRIRRKINRVRKAIEDDKHL